MKTLALIALLSLSVLAQTADYTRYVNPFIGTGGHGHTFPGAVLPFGMVQLSPDTRTDNWDGSSGYHYSDDVIYGFSHTHLSGTGIPDGCDILVTPTISDSDFTPQSGPIKERFSIGFSHENETAQPGYYSVRLNNGILAELTATQRVGLHRYTFPESGEANILVDLKWRDRVLNSQVKVVGNNRIEGFRESSSWAKDQKVYFVLEFSKSFTKTDIKSTRGNNENGSVIIFDPEKRKKMYGKDEPIVGENLVTKSTFRKSDKYQLTVKVAISSVSIEGARKNLAAELPGWDFDKVRADAKAAWNKELSKIEVSGGTPDQMTTFYTALYHTMIHPSIFNDVDGNYRGLDGKIHNIADDSFAASRDTKNSPPYEGGVAAASADGVVLTASGSGQGKGTKKTARKRTTPSPKAATPLLRKEGNLKNASDQYTVFSLWDTFRAAHPLYTILDQKRTVDFINTFIRQYEQGGRLPVWELWGNETDTMIGYHAVSVIADAMAKGIKGFDYEKAYQAAKHSAELDHYGLAAYKKRGYISMEDENESVSKTLEYAYDDWCISRMAKVLFLQESKPVKNAPKATFDSSTGIATLPIDVEKQRLQQDFGKYLRRARFFENLFDTRVNFFVPRKNGGFIRPFAPNEVTFNFTEGNSWVYTFFVPQDTTRLMELMGGREYFADKLLKLFTTEEKLAGREQPDITGLIGQYAHGNEPSHHIPYLFDYAGMPWMTQMYLRKIMDEFYKNDPDGLIGNEDCGQMSAWYILSASGFYEVTPGSGVYAIGTPLFPKITYHLENGRKFTIQANGVSEKNKYIRMATLNGEPYKKAFLNHTDIVAGGSLVFEMADAPVKSAFDEFPSTSIDSTTVAIPRIERDRTFRGNEMIFIGTADANTKIYYTLDGTEPSQKSALYLAPFRITGNAAIKAISVSSNGEKSLTAEARFNQKPNDWTVQIFSKYNRQYTGGGDEGLIDGIRGTTSFASGEWQGYQGQDFVAVVDLQRPTEIRELGGGFLQNAGSWIWMPTRIEFELSDDNQTWHKAAEIKTDVAPDNMDPVIRDFTQTITPTKARYVRTTARNFGKIPTWHPGSGGEAFIFVDEILIR